MNNPDATRRQKRFFASDFLPIKKEDVSHNMDDGFDIHKALKLNVIQDEETEANRPVREKPVRIRQEPIPIPPREPSTRIRRQNTMLRDYELRAEPVHDPRPPRLSLKIPKKIWDDGVNKNIAIPEPEPPKLSLKIPKKIWDDGVDKNKNKNLWLSEE